ncbi:MAG: hypothetical protein ACQEQV_07565, partial [Fibrobacterota bacterium]
ITTFNNPQRAIAYIQRRQDIDVLITDMHMGAFSGFDVLRATGMNAIKMVISGDISPPEMGSLERMGIRFYDKPLNVKQLIHDISTSYV